MHQLPCSPGFCSVMEGRVLAGRRRSWRTSEPRGARAATPQRRSTSGTHTPFPRKPRARPAQPIFDFEWHCAHLQPFQLFGDKFPSLGDRPSMLRLNLHPHLAGLCPAAGWLLSPVGPLAVCTLQALKPAVWVAWLCRCCRQFGGLLADSACPST